MRIVYLSNNPINRTLLTNVEFVDLMSILPSGTPESETYNLICKYFKAPSFENPKVDYLVVDDTLYKTVLKTVRPIEAVSWKLINAPLTLSNVSKVIVLDTTKPNIAQLGAKYVDLISKARDYPELTKIIPIENWKEIIELYKDTDKLALDFEASGLRPQKSDFYIGGVGLFDGKTPVYILDTSMETTIASDDPERYYKNRPYWVELGKYLSDNKELIVYNLGYENTVFATWMGGVIKKPRDVLADLRCLVKSGSLKVTAPSMLGITNWADDVVDLRESTDILLSKVRPMYRGKYKWHELYHPDNEQPLVELGESLLKIVTSAITNEFNDSINEYISYIKTKENPIVRNDDVIFNIGRTEYTIHMIDDSVPEEISIDQFEMIKNNLINKVMLSALKCYDVSKALSAKDVLIYNALNTIHKILNSYSYPFSNYEKLVKTLLDEDRTCLYTDIPAVICAKYCMLDTINTYRLYEIVDIELIATNTKEASEIYQRQDVLANQMNRAGIAWDDKWAEQISQEFLRLGLWSLKNLILGERAQRALKLSPADVLEIESTTSIEKLKEYLNPASSHKTTVAKVSYIICDKFVKMASMYQSLHENKLMHKEEEWFTKEYPVLSKYYYELCEHVGTFDNWGTDSEGNKLKFKQLSKEQQLTIIGSLRKHIENQIDNFSAISESVMEYRKTHKFEGQNPAAEFELLRQTANYVMPGTASDSIEHMYLIFTNILGVVADYDYTWCPAFWNLYYFRLHKKVMKSYTAYICGGPGRERVCRRINDPAEDTYKFDKQWIDVSDKDDDKAGWVVQSDFSPNTAETKRWRCLSGDTTIPLLDGRTVAIKDMQNEVNNYVYSYDLDTKKFMPGKIVAWKKTSDSERLLEITFDSGLVIKCTPDHRFLRKSHQYVRADNLKINDSIEALELQTTYDGYEAIVDDANSKPVRTHHRVALYKYGMYNYSGKVIHHKNFNKKNNHPSNLMIVDRHMHWRYHADHANKLLNRPDVIQKRTESIRRYAESHKELLQDRMRKASAIYTELRKTDPHYHEIARQCGKNNIHKCIESRKLNPTYVENNRKQASKHISRMWITNKDKMLEATRNSIKHCHELQWHDPKFLQEHAERNKSRLYIATLGRPELLELYKQGNLNEISYNALRDTNPRKYAKWNSLINYLGSEDAMYQTLSRLAHNHRIISIKECPAEATYDIEVERYHNFVIGDHTGGVVSHNCFCHTVPWNSSLMDMRISRFKNKGIRIHYDYSQAEVRVMSRASGDPTMLDAFYHDKDIHRLVASKVFGKPEAEISDAERRYCKMAVFSLLYGKTAAAFGREFMQGDVKGAEKLFNDFFTQFPKVRDFVKQKHREALEVGYVRTIYGDPIFVGLPDWVIDLPKETKEIILEDTFSPKLKMDRETKLKVATALRHAQNYVIQSASSSLAATCMKYLWDRITSLGSPAVIDCFTHDSADIDTPLHDIYKILKVIPEEAVLKPREKFGVPMKIDIDLCTSGDQPVSIEKFKLDDETMTITGEYEAKKSAMERLRDRLEADGIKCNFEIDEETTTRISMKELFTTRRAYSLNIGKDIPFVKGKFTLDFSGVPNAK